MPYVQRNHKGEITGLFAARQPQRDGSDITEPDPLPEDHPEVVAFRKRAEAFFGPPPPPRTEDELRAEMRLFQQENRRVEHEVGKIKRAVEWFDANFNQLEIALSALLATMLNIPGSRAAHAIYFSPNSFDARVEIVSNVLVQLASEKGDLSDLQPLWRFIENKIDSVRRMRNSLAHGVLQSLVIRGKSHVRFSPLAFDVIRLGRPIDKGNMPGLTASDIMQSAMSAERLVGLVDRANKVFSAHYYAAPTLPLRFEELRDCVRDVHSPLW
jgi:hypothetical protein